MSRVTLEIVCLYATLLIACGCQQDGALPSPAAGSVAPTEQSERAIEFADRTWTYFGPTMDTDDVWRPSMSAVYYTTDVADLRLIEHLPRKGSGEGVYSRMLHVQINRDGSWINHGPCADWTLDGTRGEFYYLNGEGNGTQRNWHPNGQLWIEREWVNGKMHGRARGWHENGQLEHDATYVNGVEIEGRNWDENGSPL